MVLPTLTPKSDQEVEKPLKVSIKSLTSVLSNRSRSGSRCSSRSSLQEIFEDAEEGDKPLLPDANKGIEIYLSRHVSY